MNELQPIITAFHAITSQASTLAAGTLTLIAAASVLVKALQTAVDSLPTHATADTVFGAIVRLLDKVSHVKVLNALALNPTAPHAAQVTK